MKKNIIVKKNSVTYQIPPQNVVYMEKDLRRIVIRFLYCHRSYIINMDEIIIMSHNQILLSSNEGIYFGKDTYRKAQKTFEEYMQRKRKEFS